MSRLFGRKLELTVSDGETSIDLSGMAVKFTVDRKFGSSLNEAQVDVWNLSPATIAKINERLRTIEISAGYQDGPRFGSIFRGEINNVITRRDGPSFVTSIFAYDGDSYYRNTRVNFSLPSESTLGDVLRAIGDAFPTLSIENPGRFDSIRLSGPQSYHGHARLVLDEILDPQSGYSWTIDDGKIVILGDGETDGTSPVDVNRDTGMIGNPEIGLEMLDVVSLMQPAVHPGGSVRVTAIGPDIAVGATSLAVIPKLADQIPGLDGSESMKVWRVTHDGETRGKPWYTQISVLVRAAEGG